jgi:hypothetical protein
MAYFLSRDIKVFPCTYRGVITEDLNTEDKTDRQAFDPESRLVSEYNYTHLPGIVNDKKSYIVDYTNDTLKCVISGYYFEIYNISTYPDIDISGTHPGTQNLKFYINVISDTLTSDQTRQEDGKTVTLESSRKLHYLAVVDTDGVSDSLQLDFYAPDKNYYFKGLAYYIGEEGNVDAISGATTACLDITDTEGNIVFDNDIRNFYSLYHGTDKDFALYAYRNGPENKATSSYSTALGLATEAIGEGSTAFGKQTIAEHPGSVVMGLHTKTSRNNQVVSGEYNTDDADALFIIGDGTASLPHNVFVARNNNINIDNKLTVGTDIKLDASLDDATITSPVIKATANITAEEYIKSKGRIEANTQITSESYIKAKDYIQSDTELKSPKLSIKDGDFITASGKGAKPGNTGCYGLYTTGLIESSSTNNQAIYVPSGGIEAVSIKATSLINTEKAEVIEDLTIGATSGAYCKCTSQALRFSSDSKIMSDNSLSLNAKNTLILGPTPIEPNTTSSDITIGDYELPNEPLPFRGTDTLTLNGNKIELKGESLALISSAKSATTGAKLSLEDNKLSIENVDQITASSANTGISISCKQTNTAELPEIILTARNSNDEGTIKLITDETILESKVSLNHNVHTVGNLTIGTDKANPSISILANNGNITTKGPIEAAKLILTSPRADASDPDTALDDATTFDNLIYLGDNVGPDYSSTTNSYNGHVRWVTLGSGYSFYTAYSSNDSSNQNIRKLNLVSEDDSTRTEAHVLQFRRPAGADVFQLAKVTANGSMYHRGANNSSGSILSTTPWSKLLDTRNVLTDGITTDSGNFRTTTGNFETTSGKFKSGTGNFETTSGNFETTSGYVSAGGTIQTTSNSDEAISAKNGTITAQKFVALSDARLKENFRPLTLEASILSLPLYKFDFINGQKNQIGCKAQDLVKICPELVDKGSDGYLRIQESKLVYLLLEEVKNLNRRLKDLEGD